MSEFFGPPLCQRCDGTALIIGDDGEPRDCPSCINGREPVPGLDALRARLAQVERERDEAQSRADTFSALAKSNAELVRLGNEMRDEARAQRDAALEGLREAMDLLDALPRRDHIQPHAPDTVHRCEACDDNRMRVKLLAAIAKAEGGGR